jgi:hypothetical protein
MDIPESKWTDYSGQGGQYKYVSPDKFAEIKAEHAQRDKDGIPQKHENNEALNKWWKGEYGEQNFFSLRDAIHQNRCNGDEMLWYLFYSRPSKMDEFCKNTVFGNKIPEDFCDNNPASYWNWMVTEKNLKTKYASGEDVYFNECVDEIKATGGVMPHTARLPLPNQINECLRGKVKVTPTTGPHANEQRTHLERFGRKWIFTGFSKWNGYRQGTEFYKSSSLNKYNSEYNDWQANTRHLSIRLSAPVDHGVDSGFNRNLILHSLILFIAFIHLL